MIKTITGKKLFVPIFALLVFGVQNIFCQDNFPLRMATEYDNMQNGLESGKFSSDRTIEDYVRDIWHIKKVIVTDSEVK